MIPGSFREVLKKSQAVLSRLHALGDEISAQLEERRQELRELTGTRAQLEQLQKHLTALARVQQQWAADQQALIDHAGARDEWQGEREQIVADRARLERALHEREAELQAECSWLRAQLEQQTTESTQPQAASTELASLRLAQGQWEDEREALLEERAALIERQAQLQKEWQEVQTRLLEDRTKLASQAAALAQQLAVARGVGEAQGIPPEGWQSSSIREAGAEEGREQLGEGVQPREGPSPPSDEQAALLAQVKVLEHNWYLREIAFADERAAWERQLDEANTKILAVQEDSAHRREPRSGLTFADLVIVGLLFLSVSVALALTPLARTPRWVDFGGAAIGLVLSVRFLSRAVWLKLSASPRQKPAAAAAQAPAAAVVTATAASQPATRPEPASPAPPVPAVLGPPVPLAPEKKRKGLSFFLRALTVAALVVLLLPIVAIVRGAAGLLTGASAYTGAAWVGLGLSFIALFLGTIFFAYSIKYYVGTFVVLLASLGAGSRNGNGVQGARINRRSIRNGNGEGNDQSPLALGYEPFVSVHIASYNEKRVIERLLEACARFTYRNYEVILVDDSTDETTEILARWQGREHFKILHRAQREGFKGGALQEALRRMDPRAEYVVVFDADSIPFPDCLPRLLAHFYQPGAAGEPQRRGEVAAVQSYQWHVLNKSESWLTQAVRTEYAGSYLVERPFQEALHSLKMIAGTAYMVRAPLLQELGWGRSLTEDWELTLRLYLRGYKVVYTPAVETPAECVATFPRLARQRMRWAEGHTFNVRKWGGAVLRSPLLSATEKAEFAYYALYYLQAALFVVGSACWLLAELVFQVRIPEWTALMGWSLLFSNLLSLPLQNWSGLLLEGAPRKDYPGVLGALAISFLVVPFQAWAALKGLVEQEEGPWFRTPKTGRITDPVWPLQRLQGFGRWIWGRGRRAPSGPARIRATPPPRRPSRRLGWVVAGAMLAALVGLGVQAGHAPVVYANPDQLFLRDTVSSVNGADETLNVQGPAGVAKHFAQGGLTSFVWLTATSYPSGTVAAGDYTFQFQWDANACSASCPITITWGFCNAGCTTLQPAAVTFNFDLLGQPGNSTQSQTQAGSAITLSGCPCNFYVQVSVSFTGAGNSFDLMYNGPPADIKGSNITTPTLPVPERLGLLVILGLLIPVFLASRRRAARRAHA